MHVIQIGAGLNDVTKLRESAATLGPTGFVGRQIPGNYQRSPRRLLREDSATPQVSGLVDDRGLVTLKVRVAALCVFGSRTGGVADIAMASPVNYVAAKSHKLLILALQVQRDRRDLEPDANFGLLAVVIGQRARSPKQGSCGNHYGKRGSRCRRGYLFDVHGDSPKDSSQRDKRTDKRTISAEERSSKLQSTADRANPPVRRATPWFAAP
jgi:hypothetical protein